MEIYFYCSYEHSKSGFFMTRLEENELIPAEAETESPPAIVRDFFSYDRFQFLWRDLCPPVEKPWQRPECFGSFCGLRNLKGYLTDGRSAVANLAFLSEDVNESLLRRAALSILGDYNGFREMLFSKLSVGGPCGYQLYVPAFRAWVESCGKSNRLRLTVPRDDKVMALMPDLRRTQPPRLERDTLRLAACTCEWKEIAQVMGKPLNWKLKPSCVLSQEEFSELFVSRGPIWTMEAAP